MSSSGKTGGGRRQHRRGGGRGGGGGGGGSGGGAGGSGKKGSHGGASCKAPSEPKAPKVLGQPMSFWNQVYRCKACGVDSSGSAAFAQHCAGTAHASIAGYRGFAGLSPNAAGVLPPFSVALIQEVKDVVATAAASGSALCLPIATGLASSSSSSSSFASAASSSSSTPSSSKANASTKEEPLRTVGGLSQQKDQYIRDVLRRNASDEALDQTGGRADNAGPRRERSEGHGASGGNATSLLQQRLANATLSSGGEGQGLSTTAGPDGSDGGRGNATAAAPGEQPPQTRRRRKQTTERGAKEETEAHGDTQQQDTQQRGRGGTDNCPACDLTCSGLPSSQEQTRGKKKNATRAEKRAKKQKGTGEIEGEGKGGSSDNDRKQRGGRGRPPPTAPPQGAEVCPPATEGREVHHPPLPPAGSNGSIEDRGGGLRGSSSSSSSSMNSANKNATELRHGAMVQNTKGRGAAGRRHGNNAPALVPPPALATDMGPLAGQRRSLPVFSHRARLLETLRGHSVVVVEGETGSGKTTQVPQYVLEEAAARGEPCNVVVAQPRRISAMSVAERVAAERGEAIGGTVGYTIRLESKASPKNTRLLFCTTGILLKRLEEDPDLENVTHVFVDEVHERTIESDFLLMILRDLLDRRRDRRDAHRQEKEREKEEKKKKKKKSEAEEEEEEDEEDEQQQHGGVTGGLGSAPQPDLTVVLMSATLDADLFHRYFGGAPSVKFPGRTFPVTELYLEHALEATGHRVNPRADWARKGTAGFASTGYGASANANYNTTAIGQQQLNNSRHDGPLAFSAVDDEELGFEDLAERYALCSRGAIEALLSLNHNAVNYALLAEVVAWLAQLGTTEAVGKWLDDFNHGSGSGSGSGRSGGGNEERDAGDADAGAVLVFLPGIKEITAAQDVLTGLPAFRSSPHRDWVLPLHSSVPPEEQRRAFQRPPRGVRKVVLATNIAETAITIDDVAFVVDTGRMKENRYDPAKRMSSLEDCLVSKANARQRRGRAGRVKAGVAVHFFTSHRHDMVAAPSQPPEVRRVPLEQLVLRIKALGYPGSAAAVCSRLVEPPRPAAVRRAVQELATLEAIVVDEASGTEALTALGHHLSTLPVDCRVGKLLLMGAMFGVADEALTIAASLSFRSPFLSPPAAREEADRCKMSFASGQSDHLTVLRAYNAFDVMASPFMGGGGGGGGNYHHHHHQQQPQQHHKFDFARENFLGIKTLQTMGELKRQLLELLSAAGFVRAGLRCRAVEALGRRVDGSDGVRLALRHGVGHEKTTNKQAFGSGYDRNYGNHGGGGGRGGGSHVEEVRRLELQQLRDLHAQFYGDDDDDDDDDDGDGGDKERNKGDNKSGANGLFVDPLTAVEESLADNRELLKALLVAALFPQVVMVEKGTKGAGGGVRFKTRESHGADDDDGGGDNGDGGGWGGPLSSSSSSSSLPRVSIVDVALHPSCVAAKAKELDSSYLVYLERVRTTRVYVRDATPVTPHALLLFGGRCLTVERAPIDPSTQLITGANAKQAARAAAAAAASSRRGGKHKQQQQQQQQQQQHDGDVVLRLDDWLGFKVPARDHSLVLALRAQLDRVLRRKVERPHEELTAAALDLIDAVRLTLEGSAFVPDRDQKSGKGGKKKKKPKKKKKQQQQQQQQQRKGASTSAREGGGGLHHGSGGGGGSYGSYGGTGGMGRPVMNFGEYSKNFW